MHNRKFALKRGRPIFILIGTILALLVASLPLVVPATANLYQWNLINSQEYKEEHGYWETVELPEEFRINAIHAAMLPTGKVLLVAGSGNDRESFDAYHNDGQIKVLKTVVFDPKTNAVKAVETPSDLFCSGHTFLQDGNLLIAGGTSGYELLEGEVTKPAGVITLHNENPDDKTRTFKQGTKFTSETGKVYVSTREAVLEPAHKMEISEGNAVVHHSSTKVFVEAIEASDSYNAPADLKYKVEGVSEKDANNIYGQGGKMTLEKQDFRGDNKSYEFDPTLEKYVQVGDMKEDRWYPTLPVMTNGDVLAVSGLDGAGVITETTERYDPVTKKWSWGPNQEFPTYPALFRTHDPDILFFSGSSAGYGPQDKGREPGFWNVKTDNFWAVYGLRDPDITETSASVVLPPAKGSNDGRQSSRIMIAGGGGIGESEAVTSRTDIIDLSDPNPIYKPGPDLIEASRYVSLTVLPTDDIFASGGTKDYRSKGNSYNYKTSMIDPTTYQSKRMADEPVGRGYHSGSLLLPDGRVLTFGNDPLYKDENNTKQGVFEQRIGIYSPPYLFKETTRPVLQGEDSTHAKRGDTLSYRTSVMTTAKYARLIPPSSSTHVTNIEQRSIGVVVSQKDGKVNVQLPTDQNVLTNGWYMLYVVDSYGVPSEAKMVKIVN